MSDAGKFRSMPQENATQRARKSALRLQSKTVGLTDKDREELKELLRLERNIR